MPSVCEVFKESAEYVQRWQERQSFVKEETLTDWLLYNISEKAPKITYQAYTRMHEGRVTGADWEWNWWFLTDSGSVKLRVQAKKAPAGKVNLYGGIAQSNKHGLQIDMLRADAKKNNALAIYAFFSPVAAPNLCKTGLQKEGVYLASARRVYDDFIAKGPSPISALDVLAISAPLTCFACCSRLPGLQAFTSMFGDEFGSGGDLVGFWPQPPREVYDLVEGREIVFPSDARIGLPDEPRVDGTLVVDLRGTEFPRSSFKMNKR